MRQASSSFQPVDLQQPTFKTPSKTPSTELKESDSSQPRLTREFSFSRLKESGRIVDRTLAGIVVDFAKDGFYNRVRFSALLDRVVPYRQQNGLLNQGLNKIYDLLQKVSVEKNSVPSGLIYQLLVCIKKGIALNSFAQHMQACLQEFEANNGLRAKSQMLQKDIRYACQLISLNIDRDSANFKPRNRVQTSAFKTTRKEETEPRFKSKSRSMSRSRSHSLRALFYQYQRVPLVKSILQQTKRNKQLLDHRKLVCQKKQFFEDRSSWNLPSKLKQLKKGQSMKDWVRGREARKVPQSEGRVVTIFNKRQRIKVMKGESVQHLARRIGSLFGVNKDKLSFIEDSLRAGLV